MKGNGYAQSWILEEGVRSCTISQALPTEYMFEAGGKFYFWYFLDLAVSEITSPTNLDEIIEVMRDKGEKALKTKEILS